MLCQQAFVSPEQEHFEMLILSPWYKCVDPTELYMDSYSLLFQLH